MIRNAFSEIPNIAAKNSIDVRIPKVNYSINRDQDLEPQEIMSRMPVSALVYLDSDNLPAPRNQMFFSSGIRYVSGASKISFVGCSIANFYIPNCNVRNNTLTFYSSVTASEFTVVVPEGYYSTSAALIAATVAALNTVTGTSGLTFSSAPVANFPDQYSLNSAGGSYYIVTTCDAYRKGAILFGFVADPVLATSHIVGPMGLNYTQYVDVISTVLTKHQKMRSITSKGRSNIFARAFMGLNNATGAGAWGLTYYAATAAEETSFNTLAAQDITGIDIDLYDSNGELLYIPDYLADKLYFQMTFKIEI